MTQIPLSKCRENLAREDNYRSKRKSKLYYNRWFCKKINYGKKRCVKIKKEITEIEGKMSENRTRTWRNFNIERILLQLSHNNDSIVESWKVMSNSWKL